MEKYDEQFKETTIQTILDELTELSMWSVYNDDKYNELIEIIIRSIKTMKGE